MTWEEFKAKVEAAGVKDGDVLVPLHRFRPFCVGDDRKYNDEPVQITGGYQVLGIELDAVVELGLSD